jgi:hypothetical protein
MTLPDAHKVQKYDFLMLLPILGLAFYLAFIPHQNYPYPVHLDEWFQLACSNEIMSQAGTTGITDPFSGSSPSVYQYFESGFHLFWGIFHQLSGLSWLTIFKYFPGIIFIITVLAVYVLCRRQGFGWEGALFTTLIPTTVGILGPGFLVPVAMGLFFVPLCLFVAFNFRSIWSYVTLFIFTCVLLVLHSPTAVMLVIILFFYILFNLKNDPKHSLGITLAIGAPFLIILPWVYEILIKIGKVLLEPYPFPTHIEFPPLIELYGYLPVALCLLGVLVLAVRSGKRGYGLIFGLLGLLIMLITFSRLHYGISILYERGILYMWLLVSIIAGAGLMWVRQLGLPEAVAYRLKAPWITQHLGKFLCLAIIGITLAVAIPQRLNLLYYHMIDAEDYRAFTWIRDNLGDNYEIAILDPWKATAFTAITGKKVITRVHAVWRTSDEEAYRFLQSGSTNTTYLMANGVSVVYTRWPVDNPDLVEVETNIYVFTNRED